MRVNRDSSVNQATYPAGTYRFEGTPSTVLLLISRNRTTTRLIRSDTNIPTQFDAGSYRFSIFSLTQTPNITFIPTLTKQTDQGGTL